LSDYVYIYIYKIYNNIITIQIPFLTQPITKRHPDKIFITDWQNSFQICEEENQLGATQCFIELVICSTCFGHVYVHQQDLASILLVWHVECNSLFLVVGGSDAGQQAMRPCW